MLRSIQFFRKLSHKLPLERYAGISYDIYQNFIDPIRVQFFPEEEKNFDSVHRYIFRGNIYTYIFELQFMYKFCYFFSLKF
jgi:hypothetical protein